MGPECSLQEDPRPLSYMIAQEEILEEPRDMMSQNTPSLGSQGAPILEGGETWREGGMSLMKVCGT